MWFGIKEPFPYTLPCYPRRGSSNIDEQKSAISQVFPLFNHYQTCVLGARDFCSVKLANWLAEKNVYFGLRLKKNEFVEFKTDIWLELNNLGLSPGVSFFLKGVKVTKQKGFASFNVAGKWKRKILGVEPKEGWFILTNLDTLELALAKRLRRSFAAYKRRFDIEEMFRDFKTGGYNLEDTNVSGERLISLILLIAIAYTKATIQGQQIKRKGIQKYVGRVKEYGRIERLLLFLYRFVWSRLGEFYGTLYGVSDRINEIKSQ